MCSPTEALRKAYRYELRPNRQQRAGLERTAHARRFVYNWALRRSRDHYALHGRGISLKQQCLDLTRLKRTPEFAWLRKIDSQALQQPLFDLSLAYRAFFDGRARYPTFKSKRFEQPRFRIPQRVRLKGNRVYVPQIGWIVLKLSRPVEGMIKSATFKQDCLGKWHVTLVCMIESRIEPLMDLDPMRVVGIDLGIKEFAVLSDGTRVDSPRFAKRRERALRRRHRELSRKRPRSRNRAKARRRLAIAYRKTRNQRADFLHKLSTATVARYDAVCIEDLGVTGLTRTKLARALSDSGWSAFRKQLEYKAAFQGKRCVAVDRFFPSSRLCRQCGTINTDLSPRVRRWSCSCGAMHDRDLNAARNIRAAGLAYLVAVGLTDTENACGAGVSLPTGATGDEAGIRFDPEGQHGCALVSPDREREDHGG